MTGALCGDGVRLPGQEQLNSISFKAVPFSSRADLGQDDMLKASRHRLTEFLSWVVPAPGFIGKGDMPALSNAKSRTESRLLPGGLWGGRGSYRHRSFGRRHVNKQPLCVSEARQLRAPRLGRRDNHRASRLTTWALFYFLQRWWGLQCSRLSSLTLPFASIILFWPLHEKEEIIFDCQ